MGLKAAVLPDNDATNPVRIHWSPDPPGNDSLKNRFARTIRLWREAPSAPPLGELLSEREAEGVRYEI